MTRNFHLLKSLLAAGFIFALTAELAVGQSTSTSAVRLSPIDVVLTSAGQSRYVLLKNDRVQFGTVRLVNRFIEVEFSKDSKVSLPLDQVVFVGESLEEVYQFKRGSLIKWSTGDHIHFGRWCLQNGLLERAIEHYLSIDRQDQGHRAVKQLGAELELRVLNDESFRTYLGLPSQKKVAETSDTQVNQNTPSQDTTRLVQASTGGDETPVDIAAHPQIGQLFYDRVQPILINRCSQAACHGVASNNSLRLIEPKGKSRQRISNENLRSALSQIQNVNGTAKLIRYATTPHGLQKEPGISSTEAHLVEELRRWVRFVENPVATAGGTLPSSELTGAAKLTQIVPGSMQLQTVPKDNSQPEPVNGFVKPTREEIDDLEAQLNAILTRGENGAAKSPTSGDPFDPAEFNRQVLESKAAKGN